MKQLLMVCAFGILAACAQRDTDTAQTSKQGAIAADVPAGSYTLDKAHASLIFRVNHMGFSNYTARFGNFDAQLKFDPVNLAASSVQASVDAHSLSLDNPPAGFADELMGAQWLDAAQYPQISFRSTKVEVTEANNLRITGELTLHGVTRPMTLDAVFNGGYAGQTMDPQARIGFSAQGTLKRSEFGVALGIPKAGSSMGVSDDVDVVLEAEFNGPPLKGAATSNSALQSSTSVQ
ncbi:MAG: YceI family protein [Steroidobacteraceae bacterium]